LEVGEIVVKRLRHFGGQRRKLLACDGIHFPESRIGQLVQTLVEQSTLEVRVHLRRVVYSSIERVDDQCLGTRGPDLRRCASLRENRRWAERKARQCNESQSERRFFMDRVRLSMFEP